MLCKEGRCGNLVRVHRPGFICGIDVNIVAEDGASQTEGQLRDRRRERELERERGQVYIAALRLTEKEGGRRTRMYTDGAGRAARAWHGYASPKFLAFVLEAEYATRCYGMGWRLLQSHSLSL